MKKITILIALTAIAYTTIAQGVLYNNGSIIQVNTGCIVHVNGNLTNTAASTFTNNGTLTVTGNSTNNQVMAVPNNGTLEFKGNTAQALNGTTAYFAKNVLVNNAAGVTINTPLKVDGVFTFTNGIVNAATTANAVTFTNNATVTGAADASHINGYVVKEGTGNFSYPVGDGIKHQQIDVNLSASASGMQVKYNATDAGAGTYTTTGTEATALVSYNTSEYWDITPLSTAVGTVTIYWDGYKDGFFNPVSQRKVAHKTGGIWLNEGTAGTGTTANGSVTSNSVSTWSPFALGSVLQALPLTLTDFSGNRNNDVNNLYWQTQNEVNTKHFIIERSNDAGSFTAIATVAAKGTGANIYSYNDAVKQSGKLFYRLKMVDNDGRFTYSGVVILHGYTNDNVTVSPNPVNNFTTVAVSNNLVNTQAIVTDVTGKALQQIVLTHTATSINLSAYPAGMYLLKLQNGQVVKLIKE